MRPTRIACVAEKLRWAQSRKTTREEDAAYCLLGLLGVNMSLLYGEGGFRAFRRLQEEFIRQSDDEFLFALAPPHWKPEAKLSMLGSRPSEFNARWAIEAITSGEPDYVFRSPYLITNKGLQFESRAVHVKLHDNRYLYFVPLNCRNTSNHDDDDYYKGRSPFVRKNGQCVVALVEDSGGVAYRTSTVALKSHLEDLWNNGKKVTKRFVIQLTNEDPRPFWEGDSWAPSWE